MTRVVDSAPGEPATITTSAAAGHAIGAVFAAAEKHVEATSLLVSLLRSTHRSGAITRAANGVLVAARDVTLAIGAAREAHVDHIAAEALRDAEAPSAGRPRFEIGEVVESADAEPPAYYRVTARELHDGLWFYDVEEVHSDRPDWSSPLDDAFPESALAPLDKVAARGGADVITDTKARALARNLIPAFVVIQFVRSGRITPWLHHRAAGIAAESAFPLAPLTDAEQAAFVAYIQHHGPRGPVEGWGS